MSGFAAAGLDDEPDGEQQSAGHGDDGGFGAEDAAGEDVRACSGGLDQGDACVAAGHREAEDVALREVPGPVDADGQPERAGVFVGGAEQQSGLDGDGEG